MDFTTDELRISLVILWVVLSYYMYYYSAHSSSVRKLAGKMTSDTGREMRLFLYQKLSGFVFLGIIPAIIYSLTATGIAEKFGLSWNHFTASLGYSLGMAALIGMLLYARHRRNPYLNTLQMKTEQWNRQLMLLNFTGWSLYLVAYEFLFRGILLFECYTHFGFFPAIAINVAIYSAIHMVNGKDQTLGAVVFGAVACWLTLVTGTILIPIFMHIALSGFSDYLSVKMNPRITFSVYQRLKPGAR